MHRAATYRCDDTRCSSKERPNLMSLALLFHYLMLNMFRMLIRPPHPPFLCFYTTQIIVLKYFAFLSILQLSSQEINHEYWGCGHWGASAPTLNYANGHLNPELYTGVPQNVRIQGVTLNRKCFNIPPDVPTASITWSSSFCQDIVHSVLMNQIHPSLHRWYTG